MPPTALADAGSPPGGRSRPSPRSGLRLFTALSALLLPWLAPAIAAAAGKPAGPPVSGALITFYAFGALALAGAILTITRKNPVSAALFLVLTLVSTGGLYLALHATFLAAIQVLVYAGAIMVLFIFVVMSVGKPDENERVSLLAAWPTKLLGLVAIGALVFRIAMVVGQKELAGTRAVAAKYGSVEQMGRLLFTDYLFPFEAISILLLVAIVGAVMVTRRPAADPSRAAEAARGEVGGAR